MPKTLFRDNYYYELYSHYLIIYKYDLFDQRYIKIDQCFLQKLPKKYETVIEEINRPDVKINTLEQNLMNIKITT